MQDLLGAIQKNYLEQYGLVTVYPGGTVDSPGMGNGLLHWGLLVAELAALGQLGASAAVLFRTAADDCQVTIPAASPISLAGLFVRHPLKRADRESWDDYVGIAGASYFCGGRHARDIAAWGEHHHWTYDNLNPNAQPWESLDKWFWRFPGLVTFFRACAGEPTHCWERIPLFLWMLSNTAFKAQAGDTQIKTFIVLSVMADKRNPFFKWLRLYWMRRMRAKFGQPSGAFESYFAPVGGVRHPMVLALD